jgi:hypothetical protein
LPLDQIGPESQRKPVRVGLARPEYLVLMGIYCGVEFPVDRRGAMTISRGLERRIREHAMHLAFSEELAETMLAANTKTAQS